MLLGVRCVVPPVSVLFNLLDPRPFVFECCF